MSVFGVFAGWQSRKRGLLERLHHDVKVDVLQVYGVLLRDYRAKLNFLVNGDVVKLRDVLRSEQVLAGEEMNAVANAVSVIEGIIKKESVAGDESHEEQLRKELSLLLQHLNQLESIISDEISLLNNLSEFKAKLAEEGRILAVEQDELYSIEKEFELLLAERPEIISAEVYQQRLRKLQELDFPASKFPEQTKLFIQNWKLVEELISKTKPEDVHNLFWFGLRDVVEAGLVKTREDLVLLVELAGRAKPEHVFSLFRNGLPAVVHLIKTREDLRAVGLLLIELAGKAKPEDVFSLFGDGLPAVVHLSDLLPALKCGASGKV